jgi:hypothetical protein
MLWKTIIGKAAAGNGKSKIVKHALTSNSLLQGNLQRIYLFPDRNISNSAQNAQKILIAQGTQQRFQGISRQGFEQIRVTGRFMTAGVSVTAKQQ